MPVSEEQMAQILADIHIAEYYSQGKGDLPAFKRNTDSLAAYYKSILQHHGISLDSFKMAYDWFAEHPVAMDSLYTHVLNNLEQVKSIYLKETDADTETTQPVQDSVAHNTNQELNNTPKQAEEL